MLFSALIQKKKQIFLFYKYLYTVENSTHLADRSMIDPSYSKEEQVQEERTRKLREEPGEGAEPG